MRSFKDINEARGDNTAVFTFGRFNPPTTGHGKLLDALAKQAKKNGAPYYVFASHSENAKKDPLPYVKKVAYMKKMFPKHARSIFVDKARQVFEVAVSLYNKGHKSVVMVVGSDRVAEFDGLLKKYNKMEGRHGYYEFENIQVISAGERDPDSEGVSGMSASKMRASAVKNQYLNVVDVRGKVKEYGFEAGLPKGFGQGMSLFKDVRNFMGVRESFVSRTESFTEEDVARDMYIRGEILNIGDVVTESYSGVSGKIIRRGTNYVTFAEEDGTPHKKWLYELDEMSTGQLIKQVISRTTKKKGYEKAAEVLKTVIDRKRKENDLSHDIVYYATQIAKSFAGIDGRTLARTYEKIHGVYEVVKQDKDIKDRKGSEPAKYYAKDADGDEMSVATKKKRAAHFAKSKDGPAPGDKDADTKPSKHTKKFKDMFGEEDPCWDTHKQVGMKKKGGKMVPNCVAKEDFQLDEKIEGLITKADKSGMPYGILKKVYDRGMAAWKTGHRPGTTPQQWAFARVNSFVTKSSGTWGKADKDLAQQVRGEETVEDSREIGTDAQRTERQKMTPGQPVISFKEHIECGTEDCCQECETASLIESNVYRVGSEKYYEFFQEKRVEYKSGEFNPTGFNKDLMEGDIGKYAIYEGKNVALECPMMEADYQGTEVELNKPKSGGSKKYYVYVKNDKGNVIKVSWGDTTGLKVKLNDPAARKSFAARHDCANKKDKTKAGYWACNLPRYAKQLGLSGGGSFFW